MWTVHALRDWFHPAKRFPLEDAKSKMASSCASSDLTDPSVVTLTFPKKQHDLAFNNKWLSDVTLVSTEGEKYYALCSLLQRRWLWFATRRNVQMARNIHEDDNSILVDLPGKMLYLILKWVYFDTVQLRGWRTDDLVLLLEKCEEFKLPEIKENVLERLVKHDGAVDGKMPLSKIVSVFDCGAKTKNKDLMDTMVTCGVQHLEDFVETEEYGSSPAQLVARIVGGIHVSKYPTFFKSFHKWSSGRSSEELYLVMTRVKWSSVPTQIISALVSQGDPWSSAEVEAKLSVWKTTENERATAKRADIRVKMTNEEVEPGPSEKRLKLEDVKQFYCAEGPVPSGALLFSNDQFYECTGTVSIVLQAKFECRRVAWNCKQGSVWRIGLGRKNSCLNPRNGCKFVNFPIQEISRIVFHCAKGTLINNLSVTP